MVRKSFVFIAMFLFLFLLSTPNGGSVVKASVMVDEMFEQGENGGDEAPAEETAAPASITFFDYVKVLGALIFVIILLYALLKFFNKKTRSYQQSKLIYNLGGTTLGGNRSVQVVKVGGHYFVLGVGEDVNLIKEVTDPAEIEQFEAFYEGKQDQMVQQSPISKAFEQWKSRKNDPEESQPFHKLFAQQLEEQKAARKIEFKKAQSKENQNDG